MIGDIVGLRRRLAAGADPNQWDSHHGTPLRQACEQPAEGGAYPDEDQEVVDRLVPCYRPALIRTWEMTSHWVHHCHGPLREVRFLWWSCS